MRGTGGTYGSRGKGGVGHDGESCIELLIQAHDPHRIEGIDDRNTPSVEAGKQSGVNQRERLPREAKDRRTCRHDAWKSDAAHRVGPHK